MPQQKQAADPPSQARGPLLPHTTRNPSGVDRLAQAVRGHRSHLSIGLEPCRDYLPRGFSPDIAGYESFLRLLMDATAGVAAAYKANLAYFEALGPAGWDLLHRIRQAAPADAFFIADAKRGDIGPSAERYAHALYASLRADSATVNPLMGRDACEPFLAHADRLTFVLMLTSNPGAADFLARDDLYQRIGEAVVRWGDGGNAGLVVGATRGELVARARAAAPGLPFLVPGLGAQGGALEQTARLGRTATEKDGDGGFAGLLFHVTRGVLPGADESGDPGELIRSRAERWRAEIAAALGPARGGNGP
jgi:orotidine-5'-phosphate decarboxylase